MPLMVEQYKQFISATGYRLLPDISTTDNHLEGVSWDDVVACAKWTAKQAFNKYNELKT